MINKIIKEIQGVSTRSYVKLVMTRNNVREGLNKIVKEEEGMGMIELALIIVIVIGVAVIFKEKVQEFMNEIFQEYKVSDVK